MIEIDDAGSGSLIGGTGIGIMRVETGEYFFSLIPLELFQAPHFMQKEYQKYVINIVKERFNSLGVTKSEPVRICRGYIFDELRRWLACNGYNWENTKIDGILQELVEESFSNYVIELGLPRNFVQHARYAFGFHRLLKWVFADFANRSGLCKSGWKSWNKWCNVEQKLYQGKADKKGYCLKCGKMIRKNEKIVTIEYCTNRLWQIDLHPRCYQGQGTHLLKRADVQC